MVSVLRSSARGDSDVHGELEDRHVPNTQPGTRAARPQQSVAAVTAANGD
jgi:hypothetical protein